MGSLSNIILAAIFVVSATLSAEALSTASDVQIVLFMTARRTLNATKEMESLYPFITASTKLQDPPLTLGLFVATPPCSVEMQLKEKLSIPYMKLSNYISPLYMAFSYEEKQCLQHIRLAQVLRDTSHFLNTTVSILRHELQSRKFPLPAGQVTLTEEQLDQYTREYLQILANSKELTLVITDNVVKTYRNYVILYTLQDVIKEVPPCVARV